MSQVSHPQADIHVQHPEHISSAVLMLAGVQYLPSSLNVVVSGHLDLGEEAPIHQDERIMNEKGA